MIERDSDPLIDDFIEEIKKQGFVMSKIKISKQFSCSGNRMSQLLDIEIFGIRRIMDEDNSESYTNGDEN